MKEDLRHITLADFADFIFARHRGWQFCDHRILLDAEHIANIYVQLGPELLEKYDDEQLEQGFWVIQGAELEIGLARLLWDARCPLEARIAVIKSTVALNRDFLGRRELPTSTHMLWDSILTDPLFGPMHLSQSESIPLLDTVFESLTAILNLDPPICQDAALHGLNHLDNPAKERVIEKFIASNPGLSEEQVDYCMRSIEGHAV